MWLTHVHHAKKQTIACKSHDTCCDIAKMDMQSLLQMVQSCIERGIQYGRKSSTQMQIIQMKQMML